MNTRAFALRRKWEQIRNDTAPEHCLARHREERQAMATDAFPTRDIESWIRPKGTWQIQVWDARYSPRYGWQCYYGAYLFHKRKLAYVIKFIREQCFFCHDLNDSHHTEARIRNVRTGAVIPFSVLFRKDEDWLQCQENRRVRDR